MAAAWYNTEGEWEMVNDDGFIFKRRKRNQDVDVAPLAVKEEQAQEEQQHLPNQTLEREKKKQMLLATEAMLLAEVHAWEKLAEAAEPPAGEPHSSSDSASPNSEHDPHGEYLQELEIEVENFEEYVKRLEDNIILAEATYKLLVKDIREDANFQPAEQIVRALTADAQTNVEATDLPIQTPLGSTMSITETTTD